MTQNNITIQAHPPNLYYDCFLGMQCNNANNVTNNHHF